MNNIFAPDGFYWWMGVVEDRDDPLKLGRVRVRILGYHLDNKQVLPTDDLPWAMPLQPITSAATSGVGSSPLGPVAGTWVMGFFVDGKDCQQPMIMGTIAGMPDPRAACMQQKSDQNKSAPGVLKDSSGNTVTDGSGNPIQTPQSPTNANTTPSQAITGTLPPLNQSDVQKLMDALGKKESGSIPGGTQNYAVVNQIGFVGKYQFGAPALQTVGYVRNPTPMKARKNSELNDDVWSGKNGVNSMADWKANKNNCQELAMFELLKNNYKSLTPNTIDPSGEKGQAAGYLAVAHLLGPGGARKLKAGEVGKDANGTTGTQYYALGGGAVGGSTSPTTGSAPGEKLTQTNKDPAGPLNKPGAGNPPPFSDPDGRYPDCEYNGSQDTNKLAQADPGDVAGTVVEDRYKNRDEKIETADGKVWDEPAPAYNAKYPFNKVTQSEAGHIFEMDDTPGGERIHLAHAGGTYFEVDKTGTFRRKIIGDNYEIIVRNNNVYVKGNCNLTVEGAYNLMVKDTADVVISGVTNVTIKDDANINVSGDASVNVKGDLTAKATNISMNATADINLSAGKSLNMSAGANARLSAGASVKINGGTMSLDAGNVSINSGGMLGGIAGALGGGVLDGALGGAVGGLTGLSGLADLAGVADLTNLGELATLDVGALNSVAGFDVGQIGSLTGLPINTLGDLAQVNVSGIGLNDIRGIVNLDQTQLTKLAGAAGVDVAAIGGIENLNLSHLEGKNLTQLGQVAGVDVTKLTSLAGIKDLARVSNLSNIGNQLGLENIYNKSGIGSLVSGLGDTFKNLALPSLSLENVASFSPSALTQGRNFVDSAVSTGTFSQASLAQGDNIVQKASSNILSELKLPTKVTDSLGKVTNLNQIGQKVSNLGLIAGGVGLIAAASLIGKTSSGVRYNLAPAKNLAQPTPVVNEFKDYSDFPETLQLSKHFTLANLTTRVAEPLLQTKITSQHGLKRADIAHSLKALAVNTLDPIKDKYQNMQIVNAFQVSQTDNNQMTRGEAANLQFFGVDAADYFDIAVWIMENVAFDQLILNYKTTGDTQPWIYISFNKNGNRAFNFTDKVQTYMNNTKAMDGLVDLTKV